MLALLNYPRKLVMTALFSAEEDVLEQTMSPFGLGKKVAKWSCHGVRDSAY